MPLLENDWKALIRDIKNKNCTPFLGAGACYGVLPLGGEIAQHWAEEYGYPLDDTHNLISVAQFLAVEQGAMFPKEEVAKIILNVGRVPDYKEPDEPHRVLASLPLPVYITTNYDDFMTRALARNHRDPERELCRWNSLTADLPSAFDRGYQPTPARPTVFHLHGYAEVPFSLVLTEDDYINFHVNLASNPSMIPPPVRAALSRTSLLFIGYRLADSNFRVLLEGISRFMERSLRRMRVVVMPPPPSQAATDYLTRYYESFGVKVYWGTVRDFTKDLSQRWTGS